MITDTKTMMEKEELEKKNIVITKVYGERENQGRMRRSVAFQCFEKLLHNRKKRLMTWILGVPPIR